MSSNEIKKSKEALLMVLESIEDVDSLILIARIDKMSVNLLTGTPHKNIDTLLNLKEQESEFFDHFYGVWKAANDINRSNGKSMIDHLREQCTTPLKFTKIKHRVIESFIEAEVPLPPSISEAVNVDELALSMEDNKAIFTMMISKLDDLN